MKKILGLCALALSAGLSAAAVQELKVQPGSTVSYEVHARKFLTKEVIIGVNDEVSGSFVAPEGLSGNARAQLKINSAAFKSGIAERDEHVRGSLKAAEHPALTFILEGLGPFDPGKIGASGVTVTARGTLTVAGQGAPVEFPAWISRDAGRWRVVGTLKSGFKALKVSPPGIPVLVGVRDELILKADLFAAP